MSFDFSQGKIAVIDNSVEEFSKFRVSYYETAEAWEYETYTVPVSLDNATTTKVVESVSVDWLTILLKFVIGIYIIGIIFCLSKLFWTFRRLRKMILMYPKTQIDGITIVSVSHPIAPFSCLRYAFVYEGVVDTQEFDQIIAHEKTHIDQKHSIDLIFVQFLAAFLWFNPLIWKLINSLKTTHEYIADKKIIKAGYSLVDYQTLLLRQLVSDNSYGLVHNFNLSFIKKRITMMKSNKSGFIGKLKVALTITCAILFSLVLFQCNSKIDEKSPTESKSLSESYIAEIKSLSENYEADTLLNNYRAEARSFIDSSKAAAKLSEISNIYKKRPIFSISNDKLFVDGKHCEISEVKSILEKASLGRHGLVELRINANQKMKKVREFQTELRRLDRRKVIYYGEAAFGEYMIQPFLVPPFHWADPSRDDSLYPKFDLTNATMEGNVATLNGIEYLQLNLSSTGINYKEEVYKFVSKHANKKSIAYLVSAAYDDDDIFENYITNLTEVFQGFEKVFQVRAQEIFDKDRNDLKSSEYLAISKGIAKAVFIAEE
jgi:hypothetical protein